MGFFMVLVLGKKYRCGKLVCHYLSLSQVCGEKPVGGSGGVAPSVEVICLT